MYLGEIKNGYFFQQIMKMQSSRNLIIKEF